MTLNRGHLIALAAAALLSIWMLSGPNQEPEQPIKAPVNQTEDPLFSVQVEQFTGQIITPELIINGATAPSRQVSVLAETTGTVKAIHAQEGELVKAGQVIIELDPRDKPQQLQEAQANLKQRKIEFEASRSLVERKLQQPTHLAESEARLAAAQARLRAIEIELAATRVTAPFTGVLESRQVELGAYVRNGDPIAQILDFNPFLIKGHVAEKDLLKLKVGHTAKGRTLDGQIHEGRIRYISSQSNRLSRTFAVELEIANPNEHQADGLTADIRVPLPPVSATFISPALLSLNESGVLGAKYVSDNQVHFAPVQLVKTEPLGAWVSGLPNPADVIVVGQSFVSPGDKVKPVYKAKPLQPEAATAETPTLETPTDKSSVQAPDQIQSHTPDSADLSSVSDKDPSL